MMDKLEEIKQRDILMGEWIDMEYPPAVLDRRWLLGEVERLRAALEFYAEENPVAIQDDNGEIARRVLAGEE
jgi:hypothetical protein